ncbi:MAG TPA: energy transducer TonB [Nitrospiria bacterium]|nr:energy transducer TonB [Nitrospiria bacterium]
MPGYVGFQKKKSKVGTTLMIVAGLHLALAGGLVWLATTSIGQELLAYYKINIRNIKEPEPPKPKPPEAEPPKPEPPPPEPEAPPPPPVEEAKSAPPPTVESAPQAVQLPEFGNPFAGGSGKGKKFSGYIDLVTSEIQRLYKQPPDLPESLSLSVVFQLQVDDEGKLLAYRLVNSSGNPKFDQSALQAISELKKLRPPPSGMSRQIVVKFIPPS